MPITTTTQTKLLDKKIPTLIGLAVLVGSLLVGVFFIGDGLGVFAPRATPETTPKQVKITNVTDTSFTVSFATDEVTTGFLKYGTKTGQLNTQVSDDRDQLAGNVGTFSTHHVTVRGLQPQTTYYFTLGTASKAAFDNNGQPFSVKTAAKLSSLSLAQTIYGTVLTAASTPAEGSIVYVSIENAGELSTLVRSSGTWAIPLSQARTMDGTAQPTVSSTTPMNVFVQGKLLSETAQLATTVGQPQLPVETMTIGQNITSTPAPTAISDLSGTTAQPTFTASGSAATPTPTPSITPAATATPVASASAKPTATPTTRPTATPTPVVVAVEHPATSAAQPVSGSVENTLLFLVAGLAMVSFGGFLYLSLRHEPIIQA